MAKFRTKPTIIEATQWFPGVDIPGVFYAVAMAGWSAGHYVQTTHGQKTWIQPGNWIVTEPDGSGHYPIKDEIFRAKYEPILPDSSTDAVQDRTQHGDREDAASPAGREPV